MLHVQSLMRDYGEQEKLLKPIINEDVYVASYAAFKSRDGIVYSNSTWTMGVDTLLPVTDNAHFIDVDRPKEQAYFRSSGLEQGGRSHRSHNGANRLLPATIQGEDIPH